MSTWLTLLTIISASINSAETTKDIYKRNSNTKIPSTQLDDINKNSTQKTEDPILKLIQQISTNNTSALSRYDPQTVIQPCPLLKTSSVRIAMPKGGWMAPSSLIILQAVAQKIGINKIQINSLSRDSMGQAKAMYQNLEKGKRIRYAAPGREVYKVYDKLKKEGSDGNLILSAMKVKIDSIGPEKVSKHASDPSKTTVMDIQVDSIPAEKRSAFENELNKMQLNNEVKFISPKTDPGEPAFHLEIPVPKDSDVQNSAKLL